MFRLLPALVPRENIKGRIGAALAPVIAMSLIASLTHSWVPFIAAGALKIVYDVVLLRSCRGVKLEG